MTDKSLDEEIEAALALLGETPSMALDETPAPQHQVETGHSDPEPSAPEEPTPEPALQPEEPAAPPLELVTHSPPEMDILAPEEPRPPASAPLSPTLAALDENRRPKAEVVCATCPNSVWFSTPSEVACYCRVMFIQAWTTKKPGQIVLCDGTTIGRE